MFIEIQLGKMKYYFISLLKYNWCEIGRILFQFEFGNGRPNLAFKELNISSRSAK